MCGKPLAFREALQNRRRGYASNTEAQPRKTNMDNGKGKAFPHIRRHSRSNLRLKASARVQYTYASRSYATFNQRFTSSSISFVEVISTRCVIRSFLA